MIRTRRWKYILWEGHWSQLFDLENDPNEFDDLGESVDIADIRAELHEDLFHWLRTCATRITISGQATRNRTGGALMQGIIIGETVTGRDHQGRPGLRLLGEVTCH